MDSQALDVKRELRVCRDARLRLIAVCHVGRDGQLTLAAGHDTFEPNIPALDHLTRAEFDG